MYAAFFERLTTKLVRPGARPIDRPAYQAEMAAMLSGLWPDTVLTPIRSAVTAACSLNTLRHAFAAGQLAEQS